jgi:hypothetical protein
MERSVVDKNKERTLEYEKLHKIQLELHMVSIACGKHMVGRYSAHM